MLHHYRKKGNHPMPKIDYKRIFIEEPFPVYLKKGAEYLTSHQLMDFARCPRLYHLKKTGALTTDTNKTSADMILGSAAHTLILEGRHVFDSRTASGCHGKGRSEYRPQKPSDNP